MPVCLFCKKETSNPKFCSQSCSAKHNNARDPKRQRTKRCKGCPTKITCDRSWCPDCWKKKEDIRKSLRIKDLVYKHLHRSSYFSKIRVQARKVYYETYDYKCSVCGYDTVVEVAHIKPLSSFPEDTLITEVNSLDNLIGLCPNHHWEMDHGVIEPLSIQKPLIAREARLELA